VSQFDNLRKTDGFWPTSRGPRSILTNATRGSDGGGGQTGADAEADPGWRGWPAQETSHPAAKPNARVLAANRPFISEISP
jgi:hypothetical protein